MRLVIARCAVDYEGRLSAHLPMAVRLIMVKRDGCVAIHADGGAYKPLNWMVAPNRLIEGDGEWTVTNPKGERLVITIDEVLSDSAHDLGTQRHRDVDARSVVEADDRPYRAVADVDGSERVGRPDALHGAHDALDLVGIAVHGPRNGVDKVLKGARMHP